MYRLFFIVGWSALGALSIIAQDRVLFRFDDPKSAEAWRTVNDGVMGGRSIGRVRVNEQQNLEFYGTLSLENNGGFASVRARGPNLRLAPRESVIARVRGDGRQYSFNLYTQSNLGGYSYRQSFTTIRDQWIDVRLPVEKFVATFRGRVYPNERLDLNQVAGMGILLGDKQPGPFQLEMESIKARTGNPPASPETKPDISKPLTCEGTYPHHLQGICTDGDSVYWSFTTTLVKTDWTGGVLGKVSVANHHGDLCVHDGKLYVAVNLGRFNDPAGNADSWVYVYNTDDLAEIARHETQEVFHGAGGIGFRERHFYVVGGLPDGIEENYVYQYDSQFNFIRKHVIDSGHTFLGIQTVTFAHDRWWFGCYGTPRTLLVTDANFRMQGRYQIDCSLGIASTIGNQLLIGGGQCKQPDGCTGHIQIATPDAKDGFRFANSAVDVR